MPENIHLPNFDRSVLPYRGAAYKLALRLTRNEEDAEDMVQESFLRAFRFFAGFNGGDARAWLLTIVRNTCFTWLHASRPFKYNVGFDENLFPSDPQSSNPEDLMFMKGHGHLVRCAVEKLPPNFREILCMREIEGMSYREIADITGIPVGTVMSRLSRARDRLHEMLSSHVKGDSNATFSPSLRS